VFGSHAESNEAAMSTDPPFAYRLDHHDGDSTVTLERARSYTAAVASVNGWAEELRRRGAAGSILVVEEAFGTAVARHPLDPVQSPFDPGHVKPPRAGT